MTFLYVSLFFIVLVTPTPQGTPATPTASYLANDAASTATPVPPVFERDMQVSLNMPGGQPDYDDTRGRVYRIGVGDVLLIEIFGMPDMSKTVVVSEDGFIPYHFIGSVLCVGLTPSDLETLVTDMISPDYLKNPQVSVVIKEFNSKKVYILGEVKHPGSYVLKKITSLIEIISQAGGLTAQAGNKVLILRKKTGPAIPEIYMPIPAGRDEEVLHVDLRKLFSGNLSYNLEVKNHDTIYIPQTDYFFITGAVQRPGTYPLEPNMTILQAVTLAGGFTEKASKRKVKVIREIDLEQKSLRLKVSETVLSQDTIIVEESFF